MTRNFFSLPAFARMFATSSSVKGRLSLRLHCSRMTSSATHLLIFDSFEINPRSEELASTGLLHQLKRSSLPGFASFKWATAATSRRLCPSTIKRSWAATLCHPGFHIVSSRWADLVEQLDRI